MERQAFDVCKCCANGGGTPRWTMDLSGHVYHACEFRCLQIQIVLARDDQEYLLSDTYATTHGEDVMCEPHLPSAALFGCWLCATVPTNNIPLLETNAYSTHARQQRRQTKIKNLQPRFTSAELCALPTKPRANPSLFALPQACTPSTFRPATNMPQNKTKKNNKI